MKLDFKDRPSPVSRKIWLTMALFCVLFIAFVIYVVTEKRIDRANDLRQISYQLADELRQSSDDLTRMARTYVVTGNPSYQQYYRDILDIREGKKPRPEGYFYAYWDMVLAQPQSPRADSGQAIALLELMQQAGFADEELGKLAQAKAKSDGLTTLEFEAMKLLDSVGPDAEARRARARLMLHDENYHRAKATIMQPINEFFLLMDNRTLAAVRAAENTALLFRMIFIAISLATLFMLWRAYAALRATLGGSADEVHAQMLRMGHGDFSAAITVAPGMEGSVLAGLAEMQRKLNASEAERKQAENSLRASTERLNEAQRIARVGSWTLDLLSGQLIWSDEIFRLFEIDPNQFGATYEAFLKAIHPEDRAAVNRAYSESLANRTPYEISHRLLMRDGRIKWVHERCTSDFDAAGKPLRSQGTVQDITERSQIEAALRESARLLDSVIENLPVMLFLKRASDLRMVMFNKAGEDMLGFSRAELLGKGNYDCFPKEQADFFTLKDRQVLNVSGIEDIAEEVITTRDGSQLILHTIKVALRDENGQPQYLLGISENITERKRMEDQVLQLAFYDPLTKLPNRRLLNDRLSQALAASKRSGCHGALMFLDLDNFKPLNDLHGHGVGDLLLIEAADRLKSCVREMDTVARFGGDEFVVLLSELNATQAESAAQAGIVAEKIRIALAEPYRLTLKHEDKADTSVEHRCTSSIGVALFIHHEAQPDDILKWADTAMYQAKEAGRNLIRFHEPTA